MLTENSGILYNSMPLTPGPWQAMKTSQIVNADAERSGGAQGAYERTAGTTDVGNGTTTVTGIRWGRVIRWVLIGLSIYGGYKLLTRWSYG